MTVHVLGSLNMDLVVTLDRMPLPGETVFGHTFTHIPGGKGLNQAIAAARAGASVSLTGAVGNDAYGRDLLDRKSTRLNSSHSQQSRMPSSA